MAQELLYSSDKQRLLNELAQATSGEHHTKYDASKCPENVDELHDLFGKIVGLPQESDEDAQPAVDKAPRMTHQQLSSMRHVVQQVQNPRVSIRQKMFRSSIQFWCGIKSLFCTPVTNRRQSQEKGHLCAHCGANLPFAAPDSHR